MKRVFALFVSILMLMSFAACGPKTPVAPGSDPTAAPTQAVSTQEAEAESKVAVDPETDFNNRFSGYCSIWENDDMYAWIPVDGSQLYYYDKAADDFGVLCPLPECMHPLDESCAAFIPNSAPALSYQNGRLYYTAFHHETGSMYDYCLYSVSIDGSGKTKVMDIPTKETLGGTPQMYYIHRGVLYISLADDRVEDSVPYQVLSWAAIDLESGELTKMYEERFDGETWVTGTTMVFMGKYAYMLYSAKLSKTEYHNKIMRWDSEEKKLETVMDLETETPVNILMNGGIWVDEELNFYYSTMGSDRTGEMAKVFRVEEGEPVEILDFAEEEDSYDMAFVSDGVAISIINKNGDQMSKMVWIQDFGGETVYKGDLPLDFAQELEGGLLAVMSMNGNRNELIAEFEAGSTSGEGAKTHYLVKYSITENGLEYKLLGKCATEQ